jgi:hypothetical protein
MMDMEMPFFAFAFFLIVAFLIGVVVGATLKGPADDPEKKDTPSTKLRTYTITFTEDQLNAPKQPGENRVFLDISDWKPSPGRKINLVKPPEVLNRELVDKKLLDRINRKPPIDIEKDLLKLRDERKKKARNKDE